LERTSTHSPPLFLDWPKICGGKNVKKGKNKGEKCEGKWKKCEDEWKIQGKRVKFMSDRGGERKNDT
jgi:hypothetical protein